MLQQLSKLEAPVFPGRVNTPMLEQRSNNRMLQQLSKLEAPPKSAPQCCRVNNNPMLDKPRPSQKREAALGHF